MILVLLSSLTLGPDPSRKWVPSVGDATLVLLAVKAVHHL